MKTRRAISLAELLVVMSTCSIILTMSASLIHRAMRAQSESRSFYHAERSALRLSRQIRHDVHLAKAVSIGSGDTGSDNLLRLEWADGRTVEYSYAEGEVLRLLSRPGGAVSREQFAFPAPVELSIRREVAPSRVVLTLTASDRDPSHPRALIGDLQVEACLDLAATWEESQ
jgi:hypothetical protein